MKIGTFVRVREDHPVATRAGKDGMVVATTSEGPALVFGYDRHCQPQGCVCVGPELWAENELDLESIEQ